MARPREFNPDETLQVAIELFWEKGFYDSSVDEVVRRSGVAKYGIYGTFGTKRELFLIALKQYAKDRQHDIQAPIRKPDAALPEILAFFEATPSLTTQNDHRRGCLICNTGLELGLRDTEIGTFIAEFFTELTSVLKACLHRAVEKGQLTASQDLSSLATYLATLFRCSLMLAASGLPQRDIEQQLKIALQILH